MESPWNGIMRVVGLEPTRMLLHKILSLACLPIPPHSQIISATAEIRTLLIFLPFLIITNFTFRYSPNFSQTPLVEYCIQLIDSRLHIIMSRCKLLLQKRCVFVPLHQWFVS